MFFSKDHYPPPNTTFLLYLLFAYLFSPPRLTSIITHNSILLSGKPIPCPPSLVTMTSRTQCMVYGKRRLLNDINQGYWSFQLRCPSIYSCSVIIGNISYWYVWLVFVLDTLTLEPWCGWGGGIGGPNNNVTALHPTPLCYYLTCLSFNTNHLSISIIYRPCHDPSIHPSACPPSDPASIDTTNLHMHRICCWNMHLF